MEKSMLLCKGVVTAALVNLSALVGWKGVALVIWFVAMALDYVSGSAAAMKNKEWSSASAREGIWHKFGMILVVGVTALADVGLGEIVTFLNLGIEWNAYLLPLVCVWYVITEFGSIIENAIKLGAPVPSWLSKSLKISLDAINKKGEE